jgi:4-hydroxybutyrate dehydrogenase/sulfolactaldehyde 3-reductase
MKKSKVSFIGLGAMGQPMASNIVRKGTALTVYDIDAARMESVVALGATVAASVADAVAGAEIVITMLPATQHVEQVVTGPDGVLANLSKGSLVLDMSTIAPSGTDRIAQACAKHGVAFIDAPVGRLAYHAQRGESLFMVGCEDDATFERARPLLEAMGTTIHRCGGIGSGIRTKVVNNFMIISIVQITAEGLALAAKMGVDIATLKEVNAGTSGNNGQFQFNFANKVLQGDTEPGFAIDLAYKDIGLAMESASEFRLGLPVGASVHAVYGAARAGRYANKDFSALLEYACELNGVETPRLTPADKQG